jgi:hypothetical protein
MQDEKDRRMKTRSDARSTTKLQLEDRGETARLHLEMEMPWKVALKILEFVSMERCRNEATSRL